MIELKRCNYFTGDIHAVSSAVHSIVKFLELDGKNPVLFSPPKPIDGSKPGITNMIYSISPQIIWNGSEDLTSKLRDRSNIFRADLLVFDFWSLSRTLVSEHKTEIDLLGIDYIIVAKEYIYKNTDDINDFHVRQEYKGNKNNIWITNKIDGWSSTIDSLKTLYIRDKKIENIFKK